jgi:surfactin synthase thioesterase subunit
MQTELSVRLFCFPYAGSAAAVYMRWRRRLPSWLALHPIDLPGHGRRIDEPLETTVEGMVDACLSEVGAHRGRPFAFFGHSLGGVVAFETAMRCAELGWAAPLVLFASGTEAPSRRNNERYAKLADDAEIRAELVRLRGTPAEVLANEELMDLTLPMLRADFAACAAYRSSPSRQVECPLHVLGGTDDSTEADALIAWRDHTTREFTLDMLPGGHFFLHEQEAILLRLVEGRLGTELRRAESAIRARASGSGARAPESKEKGAAQWQMG